MMILNILKNSYKNKMLHLTEIAINNYQLKKSDIYII